MRHAIYICPAQGSDLMRLAGRWLGRNVFKDRPREQPPVGNIAALTASPRRYGFHGTVVAPFRMAPERSVDELRTAIGTFCGREAPFQLPLQVGRLGPFFALVPTEPSAALNALANRAVEHFHPFRAAPTPDEVARREPERLTERQRAMLERWHYPYVFDEFRFHMTLTGPVPEGERPRVEAALHEHFSDVLAEPFIVDALARYVERRAGEDFRVAERFAFAR